MNSNDGPNKMKPSKNRLKKFREEFAGEEMRIEKKIEVLSKAIELLSSYWGSGLATFVLKDTSGEIDPSYNARYFAKSRDVIVILPDQDEGYTEMMWDGFEIQLYPQHIQTPFHTRLNALLDLYYCVQLNRNNTSDLLATSTEFEKRLTDKGFCTCDWCQKGNP